MTRQPNLLFLYTDEQRFDTLQAYGNARITMPNLNALAQSSTVFEKAYVTQPVCTPSRATLLTGLMPHTSGCVRNNIPLRLETPCLPQMLPDGYRTGHFGKWHLGDEIYPQHGFDEWRAIEDGYNKHYSPARDRNERSSYHHWLLSQGVEPDTADGRFSRPFCARLPEALSKPSYLAQEASRFLRENRDRPFALYVNFLEPHMPFTSCRDDQYDPSEIELPSDFDAPLHCLQERLRSSCVRSKGPAGELRTEDDWRRLIARYWGLCSLVDTHMGIILDALRANGLDDNTIVVFTSDHGDMMGSHELVAKCVMLEEAVRVPLLLRMPGQTRSQVIRNPVSQLDLVPTLLDLMGAEQPEHLQGRSLKDAVLHQVEPQHDVVVEWNGDGENLSPAWLEICAQTGLDADGAAKAMSNSERALISSDAWKFVYASSGEHRLFDLNRDPHERRNLFADPAQKTRIRDMLGRLRAWQTKTADTLVEVDAFC